MWKEPTLTRPSWRGSYLFCLSWADAAYDLLCSSCFLHSLSYKGKQSHKGSKMGVFFFLQASLDFLNPDSNKFFIRFLFEVGTFSFTVDTFHVFRRKRQKLWTVYWLTFRARQTYFNVSGFEVGGAKCTAFIERLFVLLLLLLFVESHTFFSLYFATIHNFMLLFPVKSR